MKQTIKAVIPMIPWLITSAIFLSIVLLQNPPNGERVIEVPWNGRNPWISPFQPFERASSIKQNPQGEWVQTVTDQPVYAHIRPPGIFDEVELQLDIRPHNLSIVEMGRMFSIPQEQTQLEPMFAQAFENGWRRVTINGQTGFVRNNAKDQVLLSDDFAHVLLWHASTSIPFWMDSHEWSQKEDVSLRGAHDFYTIPVRGVIFFHFLLQEAMRSKEQSIIRLRLWKGDALVWSDLYQTSGGRSDKLNEPFEKEINIRSLEPGVYRLSLETDDDIFIRHIETTQRHWVIGPRLYLGDVVGYSKKNEPRTLWTNSRSLTAQTFHYEGLQTIHFGREAIDLKKTHTQATMIRNSLDRGQAVILQAPKGDVQMLGDGFFVFSPKAMFLPKPLRFHELSNLDQERVQAVLTSYVLPKQLSDAWKQIRLRIPLQKSSKDVRVVLSVPGIQDKQETIEIRNARLRYIRYEKGFMSWLFVWIAEFQEWKRRFANG